MPHATRHSPAREGVGGGILFDVGQLCDNPKHATSATSHGARCMAEKAASSEASPVIEITSLGGAESLFFQPPTAVPGGRGRVERSLVRRANG